MPTYEYRCPDAGTSSRSSSGCPTSRSPSAPSAGRTRGAASLRAAPASSSRAPASTSPTTAATATRRRRRRRSSAPRRPGGSSSSKDTKPVDQRQVMPVRDSCAAGDLARPARRWAWRTPGRSRWSAPGTRSTATSPATWRMTLAQPAAARAAPDRGGARRAPGPRGRRHPRRRGGRPRLHQLPPGGATTCATAWRRIVERGRALRPLATRARASRSWWSSSPPTPPAPCTWATAARPPWATPSRDSSTGPAGSVHREFYYNDAGEQIARLARSVWARYQQLLGRRRRLPRGRLPGRLRRPSSPPSFARREGDRCAGDDSPEALDAMRLFAVRQLRAEQNRDLDEFRVHFDNFFLESSLYEQRPGGGHHRAAARDGPRLREGRRGLAAHHRLRRRQGPGHGQEQRPSHLLPARRRLPRDQVGARLPPGHQRPGRRPPRHRGAGARRAAGPGPPRGLPRVRPAPDGARGARRRGGEVLQARGRLRHAARPLRGGGRRRHPLLLPHAQRRGPAHLRPGPGAGPVGEEPGLQGPVRPRPHGLDLRQAGVAAEDDRPGRRRPGPAARDGPSWSSSSCSCASPRWWPPRPSGTRPHRICDYLEETAGRGELLVPRRQPGRRSCAWSALVPDRALRRARLVLARAVQIVLAQRARDPGHHTRPERMERAEDAEWPDLRPRNEASTRMSLLVVGSVALDSVETPFGRAENALGGSATFFTAAASCFCPRAAGGRGGRRLPTRTPSTSSRSAAWTSRAWSARRARASAGPASTATT